MFVESPLESDDAVPKNDTVPQQDISPEEREQLETELKSIDEDIATLKSTLKSKMDRSNEIRTRLGLTKLAQLQKGFLAQVHAVEESPYYQNMTSKLDIAKERTIEAAGVTKDAITRRMSELKESETFKNLEQKVGNAFANAKNVIVANTYGTMPTDEDDDIVVHPK